MNRFFTFPFWLLFFWAGVSNAQAGSPVQLGFPGQFSGDFQYLNDIPSGGLDLDNNGVPDVGRPCSCRTQPNVANGASTNAGIFDSWLVVATGVSGQQWRVQYADLALHPLTLTPLPFNQVIPEAGASGVYVLHFAHRDAARYVFVLENPVDYPGQSYGPVINTCYYPDPRLFLLDDFYCSNSPGAILYGSATSPFDGNIAPIDAMEETWVIVRQQNGQQLSGPSFNPQVLGQGNYTVYYTFDAGSNAFHAANKTGCAVTVEAQTVVRTAGTPACQSSINLTINPVTCAAQVVPSMLLAGTPITYRGFAVELFDSFGNSLGANIPAEYAFVPLLGIVTDSCTGLFCTTEIIARDVHAPVLTVPADITIPCTGTPDTETTGVAAAQDCSLVQITYTDQTQNFPCGNPIARITRTWRATDVFGNTTTRNQVIQIARGTQAQLRFPTHVELGCAQYAADPSLTDPLPGKAGIPNLVDIPLCGLLYYHTDDTIGFCGNPNTSFVILRTWNVLDACGFQIYTTDGAGNSNIQFIRVSDETPPFISAAPARMTATLPPQQNGLPGCSSTGFIPPPQVFDACNDFHIRIFTPLGEAQYANGTDGASGAFVPFPGLPLGTHAVTYQATDACGNTAALEGIIEVTDSLPPVMLCNSSLNITLTSGGDARLTPQLIDSGSRDDCCIDNRLVKLEGEPDTAFRPFIDVSCPEVTQQSVVLRVVDCFGNFNECSTVVNWIDPVAPSVLSAPEHASVTCLDDLAPFFDAAFQAPVFTDNCPFEVEFAVLSAIDDCGIGALQRTWVAGGTATATQTVTVNGVFRHRFTLPDDLSAECSAGDVPDTVRILQQTCDRLTISVVTDTITTGAPGNCLSIQRTFTITNLCQVPAGTPPFTLPRLSGLDAGKGYEVSVENGVIYRVAANGSLVALGPASGTYRYVQRWDVLDSQRPQLTFSQPPPFCAENSCSGQVVLQFTATDNCAQEVNILRRLQLQNQAPGPDPFGTLTSAGPGQYRISGDYPLGAHVMELILDDACGNVATFLLPFEVRDCAPPVLLCRQDMVLTLDTTGTLELRPEQFSLSAQDNCNIAGLSFHPLEPDSLRLITCDSIGFRTVNIWLTDAAGNQAACQSNVEVIAPEGVCPEFWSIRGIVRTENLVPIAEVKLYLEGGVMAQELTPGNGQYEFLDIPGDRAYTLRPEKLALPGNGVTTFDLVLISRHILGVQPLDSPYKMIAADVNRSGTISTLDLILIRRIILGVDVTFSNNTSWRFVPADFTFPLPANPFFGNGFPEQAVLPNLKKDTVINFIGIKVGDVNASANTQ